MLGRIGPPQNVAPARWSEDVVVRRLLGALVVIGGRQASKDVGLMVLRHENGCPAPPGRYGPPHRYRPGVAGCAIAAASA